MRWMSQQCSRWGLSDAARGKGKRGRGEDGEDEEEEEDGVAVPLTDGKRRCEVRGRRSLRGEADGHCAVHAGSHGGT